MSKKPIIFSIPMVRAILNGRKTQERRIIKPQPDGVWGRDKIDNCFKVLPLESIGKFWWNVGGINGWKPQYRVDDILWVKETWADVNTYDGPAICYRADGSYQSWKDFSEVFGPDYGAGRSMDYDTYPGDYTMWWEDLLNGEPGHGWCSSVHMPIWAARLFLEVTIVKIERLQDISEQDAIAEGISKNSCQQNTWIDYPEKSSAAGWTNPIDSYRSLWNSIYDKKGYNWETNPVVAVYTFKKIKP